MKPPRDGFRHNGRIVYSLEYQILTEPPASRVLIVQLDENGNAIGPWIKPLPPRKRIVETRPDDSILHKGKRMTVIGVKVYRECLDPDTAG